MRGRRFPALFAVTATALLAGCGGAEEQKLGAPEFVSQMNRNGAALELGPPITTNEDGDEIYRVTILRPAPTPTGEGSRPAASGDASLVVLADAEAAMDEYDRCGGASTLSCYRAANVVLRVEDLQPTDRALLTSAISGLATAE